MIDDRATCDVCGEEFNEDRPKHEHDKNAPQPGSPANSEERENDDGEGGDES